MNTYAFNVKTGVGTFVRLTLQANNQYEAQVQAKALYGESLISMPIQVSS